MGNTAGAGAGAEAGADMGIGRVAVLATAPVLANGVGAVKAEQAMVELS